MNKPKWVQVIAQIFLVYISLYFLVYLLGIMLYKFFTHLPADDDKTSSGLFIGFLVSMIPFLLIGWRTKQLYKPYIHHIGLISVSISLILEKAIPLCFAKTISNHPYEILSEEFPYFSFGIHYLIFGTLISYFSFYIGAKLAHVRSEEVA